MNFALFAQDLPHAKSVKSFPRVPMMGNVVSHIIQISFTVKYIRHTLYLSHPACGRWPGPFTIQTYFGTSNIKKDLKMDKKVYIYD